MLCFTILLKINEQFQVSDCAFSLTFINCSESDCRGKTKQNITDWNNYFHKHVQTHLAFSGIYVISWGWNYWLLSGREPHPVLKILPVQFNGMLPLSSFAIFLCRSNTVHCFCSLIGQDTLQSKPEDGWP